MGVGGGPDRGGHASPHRGVGDDALAPSTHFFFFFFGWLVVSGSFSTRERVAESPSRKALGALMTRSDCPPAVQSQGLYCSDACGTAGTACAPGPPGGP